MPSGRNHAAPASVTRGQESREMSKMKVPPGICMKTKGRITKYPGSGAFIWQQYATLAIFGTSVNETVAAGTLFPPLFRTPNPPKIHLPGLFTRHWRAFVISIEPQSAQCAETSEKGVSSCEDWWLAISYGCFSESFF
jgi:hypothetical protein